MRVGPSKNWPKPRGVLWFFRRLYSLLLASSAGLIATLNEKRGEPSESMKRRKDCGELIAERGSLGHHVFPHRHEPRLSISLARSVLTAAYSEEET